MFDAQGVKKVFDACLELFELRRLRQDAILTVSANTPSGQLTTTERAALRARFDGDIDTQRAIIKAEVATWPP